MTLPTNVSIQHVYVNVSVWVAEAVYKRWT